ncbi:unnamed protein product [Moneuplotes crassus]|uniref:Uncharacterized protein n=2 Tax=Euplotes crassus TaxID=5936 RepID=A0AAD1UBF9_EUPCR|nr:unnamed protein product [Moneuplotes crassus]
MEETKYPQSDSQMSEDISDRRDTPKLEFCNNFSEIVCDTVSLKSKAANSKTELIKRQDKSEFKHTKDKWTKVFSLNSNACLCLSIQGEVVEMTIKNLFHNAALKNHEALKQRYSVAQKQVSQTKKYLDHSSDLLHQAVLQKIESSSSLHSGDEFALYYCSDDFKVIYCVRFFVSDTVLEPQEFKQAITEDYSSINSFSVSYDPIANTNTFFFSSKEFNGVLVSYPVSFGRKETNTRINFSHILGQSNMITSGITSLFNGVTKRIGRNGGDNSNCLKLETLSENLVCGVWSNGIIRIYYKRECLLEEIMFKDGILEGPHISEAILSSCAYPIDSDEDGEVSLHFYISTSVVLDSNRTIVKVFDLEFCEFQANFESQRIDYKNDCKGYLSNIFTHTEYSNKRIVDVQMLEDSLWCYSYELQNSSKGSSAGGSTAMPFRSYIYKFAVTKGLLGKDSTLKCLRNSVWSINDQLLLEKIEDKENIHSSIMNNRVIKSRYLRRFGGDYVENIPISILSSDTKFKQRLQSLKDENLDNLELVRTEHYEEEHKVMKPVSMSIIQLGKYDKVPLVVREDSISILKRNSKFTSYSKYINKNVVDIQLAYEKNPLKCMQNIVKNFKQKTKRELALSFISIFKAVYSEFIVRVEKRLEQGTGFPKSIYEIPSQSIKFDVLKLMRSQLSKSGHTIFQQCLKMLREISELIQNGYNGKNQNSVMVELTPFYTEMIANSLKIEINGVYEFMRDLLWFSNWMIINDLDLKRSGLKINEEDTHQSLHQRNRQDIKDSEVLLSALLSLKISTHSLLAHQDRLNENLKYTLFSKTDVDKHIGLNNVMPFFISRFSENILSTQLESISSMQDIFDVVITKFFQIGFFVPDQAPPTYIPLLLQQLLHMKEFDILERAIDCLKEKPPALSFALAISKAHRGQTEQFVKYFCQGITAVSIQDSGEEAVIKEQIFTQKETDPEFLDLIKNCNNPALVFAKSCLDQIDEADTKTLFQGIQTGLHFAYNPKDSNERAIVDLLWTKLYSLCRKEKDVEVAFAAATSISDEKRRESALGGLIEDLIVNDNLKTLFSCRLSNKNLAIGSSYLRKKMNESLTKVYQNDDNQEQPEFFNADRVFLKILRAFHSLHCFYNKARESCIYMLRLYYELQPYKYNKHINIHRILEIEKHLLTLILTETKSFENADRYNFYIKENDIYKPERKRDRDEEMDYEQSDIELTREIARKLFAANTSDSKYIVKLRDIEAYQAINEAQVKLFNRCGELIEELDEIIDFCVFFNWFDLAIHVSDKNRIDPTFIAQQMGYQYCLKRNEQNDEIVEEFKFEDAHFQWKVDEIDLENSEAEILLEQIIQTLDYTQFRYPHLRTEVLKVITENLEEIRQEEKDAILNSIGKGIEIEGYYDINLVLRKILKS